MKGLPGPCYSWDQGALTDSSLIVKVSCYLDSRVFVTKRGQLVQRGKGKEKGKKGREMTFAQRFWAQSNVRYLTR